MEDMIIVRSGYNTAINDVLEILKEETDIDIIKDKILRKQRLFGIDNTVFEGTIYKYYHKESNVGYIIYDSLYDYYGVMILVEEGKYKEINEKELIFVRSNFKMIWHETFVNKDLMDLRYKDLLSKFSAM